MALIVSGSAKEIIIDSSGIESTGNLDLDLSSLYLSSSAVNRLGVGTKTPSETIESVGGIKLGNSSGTNAGTIRWTGSDLEVYKSSAWASLTAVSTTRNRTAVTTHFTASTSSDILGINASAPLGIRLPAASTLSNGQTFLIKDEGGNVGTHNVEVSVTGADTIDGSSSVTLNIDDIAINLYTDGASKFFIY